MRPDHPLGLQLGQRVHVFPLDPGPPLGPLAVQVTGSDDDLDALALAAVIAPALEETIRLVVDLDGTEGPHPGNLNAPPAVVRAAVLYALRVLVKRDIPLNEGCLEPIELIVPEGCMLRPRYPAAVVTPWALLVPIVGLFSAAVFLDSFLLQFHSDVTSSIWRCFV